jgi:hypothetical protein
MKNCHTGGPFMLRKYTLYLAGALALVLGNVGCGGSHHSHNPPPEAGGYFDAAWRIFDSYSGREVSCEAAGVQLAVLATKDVYTNEAFYDEFSCNQYGGVSEAFYASDYSAALYLYADPDLKYLVTSYFFPSPSYPIFANRTTELPVANISYP